MEHSGGATSTADPLMVEWEIRVPPLQGHDRVSSRFMYSCKAFRRASISAMSAPWYSELYSVKAEVTIGMETMKQQGLMNCPCSHPKEFWDERGREQQKQIWDPGLTFDGDPATRTGQVSLVIFVFPSGRFLVTREAGKGSGNSLLLLPPKSHREL